ncbi:hypothetical protein CANCADRAFT_80533 [Tortispora caseinolytica NRRL Y-17796]|uniref:Uncharacterized protein n=1 Tax=Tortispora caseinolytica NRRL Y-17796 TaxID=767744 RepID=A0A1E4TJR9_9ASCO|nr:hypothetical protein CANCADRAFT_80533 [Tortispora caseinolytica NRRL Y-17796]
MGLAFFIYLILKFQFLCFHISQIFFLAAPKAVCSFTMRRSPTFIDIHRHTYSERRDSGFSSTKSLQDYEAIDRTEPFKIYTDPEPLDSNYDSYTSDAIKALEFSQKVELEIVLHDTLLKDTRTVHLSGQDPATKLATLLGEIEAAVCKVYSRRSSGNPTLEFSDELGNVVKVDYSERIWKYHEKQIHVSIFHAGQ